MSESYNKYGLAIKCACGAGFTVYDPSGQRCQANDSMTTSWREYVVWQEAHKECHIKILELRMQNAGIA